jgi:hypothetical protein
MAIPLDNRIGYERALLRAAAAPASVAAVPDIETPTVEFAQGQARGAVEGSALRSDVAFGKERLAKSSELAEKRLTTSSELAGKRLTESSRQFGLKLSESDREFQSRINLDRERLDSWATQNNWATAIAVANLGLEALTIPGRLKAEKKRETQEADLISTMKRTAAERDLGVINLRDLVNTSVTEARRDAIRQPWNIRKRFPRSAGDYYDNEGVIE